MIYLRRYACLLTRSVAVVVLISLPFVVYITKHTSPLRRRVLHSNGNTYGTLQRLGTIYEERFENSSIKKDASYNLKQNLRNKDEKSCVDNPLPLCPILPKALRLSRSIPVNLTAPTWKELEALHPQLESGGRWKPKHYSARSRVAIVIPYMNREKNLRIFLQHIHPFLQKQQLEYGIILAEPIWKGANRTLKFNRGLMRNIGFDQATKDGEYDCVIFHDLDLLPEVDYNYYGCPDVPRHMCLAVSYLKYKPYKKRFGGVVAFRTDHFVAANGYSNVFFGWGGEDDDLGRRCQEGSDVGVYRIPASIGRYTGAPHKKDRKAKGNQQLWAHGNTRWRKDGLNSLKYTVLQQEKRATYTWVFVDYPEQLYKQTRENLLKEIEVAEEEKIRNATKADK